LTSYFRPLILLPRLAIVENVESALVHSRISKDQIRRKVTLLLDLLALTEISNRLPLELSVGQQQKVAIARAIIKDPALILADEPSGEMDPITNREILAKLVELNRKAKITLIVASHGTLMHSEADRTLFIKGGRIVSQKEAGY
jgi:ABC-type lipoprotein export system ATPase subunit